MLSYLKQYLVLALLYSEANRNKIEQIQERALRFIYNDYNSTYENFLD
jgi:hypothetical protein